MHLARGIVTRKGRDALRLGERSEQSPVRRGGTRPAALNQAETETSRHSRAVSAIYG
jgi:hypothetical protein